MKKYVVDKGHIFRGAHISYENEEEFDSLEEAKKEFDVIKNCLLEENEYVVSYVVENDNYTALECFEWEEE